MARIPSNQDKYRINNRKSANDLSKADYNIKNFTYPIDLLKTGQGDVNEYGDNYVMFFINVSEDSKLLKTNDAGQMQAAEVTIENITPRTRARIVGRNADKKIDKGVAATTVFAGGVASSVLSAAVGISIGASGAKAGAIAAGALMFVGNEIGAFTRPQKRLQTAIALHVPNQLNIRYGANWAEEETSLFSYATTAGAEVMTAIKDSVSSFSISDGVFEGIKKAVKNVTDKHSIAQQIMAANILNASSGVSASTGLAQNPNKEQIYNGVDFRTFQMDYQFFPRSSKESENILNIIHEFKLHMAPEYKDPNNFIFIYPSEFDIAYYHGTEENPNLHRHTSSVLTDMTVNYTPNGLFNTFADGMPTQINMVLNFRELAIITKDEISAGF